MSSISAEWTPRALDLLHGTISGDIVIPEGVTTLRSYIFYGCKITSITLPQSLTTIGEYAFYNNKLLTSLVLPPYVESIGTSAFASNSNVHGRLVVPARVTTLPRYVFRDIYFDELILPEGLTIIAESAIRGGRWSYITIPSTVTSIGAYFPYRITAPQGIIMLPATPPAYSGSGTTSFMDTPFYVPDDSVEAYQNAEGSWVGRVIKPISELPDGVTPIVTQDIPEYNIDSNE